jgi:hypothetical protein
LKETRSLRAEETRTTLGKAAKTGDTATVEDVGALTEAADAESDESAVANGEANDAAKPEGEEEGSGVWKWLKRGKGAAAKKKPGKLPPRAEQATKDSREAAADILREMQRRR